jgi:phosphatidylglycerol:prolipoprotein diacylglycerol transferase
MKPALLSYPHISSYPVLLLLGFFFAWLLARSRAERYGILRRDVDNIALILPLASLFGARFFARLFYAKVSFFEALKVWEGDGLVFYGGFIFGAASVLIYGFVRRLLLPKLLDCVAPGVALGLAFGRVGCFLAGCCWGDVCATGPQLGAAADAEALRRIQTIPAISQNSWPISVQFPQKSATFRQHSRLGLVGPQDTKSLPVHPVQIYEALLAAALSVYLATRAATRKPGDIALLLLVGYGIIRFATEFLRADNKMYAFGMTFSQVVSVYILAASALIAVLRSLLTRQHKQQSAPNPPRQPASIPLH